jgi:hypothetical protein
MSKRRGLTPERAADYARTCQTVSSDSLVQMVANITDQEMEYDKENAHKWMHIRFQLLTEIVRRLILGHDAPSPDVQMLTDTFIGVQFCRTVRSRVEAMSDLRTHITDIKRTHRMLIGRVMIAQKLCDAGAIGVAQREAVVQMFNAAAATLAHRHAMEVVADTKENFDRQITMALRMVGGARPPPPPATITDVKVPLAEWVSDMRALDRLSATHWSASAAQAAAAAAAPPPARPSVYFGPVRVVAPPVAIDRNTAATPPPTPELRSAPAPLTPVPLHQQSHTSWVHNPFR